MFTTMDSSHRDFMRQKIDLVITEIQSRTYIYHFQCLTTCISTTKSVSETSPRDKI